MRDADGRFHLVDVLPALAAGAKRIHAQVLGTDVDLNAVVDFRNDEDGGERSVSPSRLVKRGDSNEAVNSRLAREKPISIFAGGLNRRRLDASFFSRCLVPHDGAPSSALRPAPIHTED